MILRGDAVGALAVAVPEIVGAVACCQFGELDGQIFRCTVEEEVGVGFRVEQFGVGR